MLTSVRRLVELRDEMGSPLSVAVQYVRTSQNAHEVGAADDLFRQFLSPGLDGFQDNISKDWGDKESADDIFFVGKLEGQVGLSGAA